MRIVTFNTGLLRGGVPHAAERVGPVGTALAALEADIVSLQELWSADDRSAVLDAVAARFPYRLQADPLPPLPGDWGLYGNTGLALVSRWPIIRHEVVSLDSSIVRRAVLAAIVDTPIGNVTVLATHLSAALRTVEHSDGSDGWAREHLAQCQVVTDLAASVDGPIVLAGDLNCGPARGGAPELAAAYHALRSAFEHSPYAEDRATRCTWCADNPLAPEEAGTILDHIMVSGLRPLQWRPVLTTPVELDLDGDVLRSPVSDHFGVAVDLHI